MFQIKGRVKSVGEEKTFSSGFKKREFIVEEIKDSPSKYENVIKFVLKKDNVALANGLRKGDEITIGFQIDGHEWEKDGRSNVFVDLVALKISGGSDASEKPVPPPAVPSADDLPGDADPVADDMPF